MLTGTYRAGRSPLHAAPAGAKLAGLLVLTSILVIARSPLAVAIGAGLVAGLYAVARLGMRALIAAVRPMWLVVPLVAVFQVWTAGWAAAVVVAGTLVVAVAAAALVTATTRISELLDVVLASARPLRVLGVDPERVALVLTLAIRVVPVLAERAREVRDARRARGLERSPRALVVPLVLQTIRHADALGESLAARGIDD